MLQVNEKDRLTIRDLLSHPFLKSSLAKTPLRPHRQVKEQGRLTKASPKGSTTVADATGHDPPPTTPTLLRERANSSRCSSTATLLSALKQVDPQVFAAFDQEVFEERKTPFGLVKIAKLQEGSEDAKTVGRLSRRVTIPGGKLDWGNGYGTRGLLSVRQRIYGGKIEVTRQGDVVVNVKGKASLVILSDGSHVDVLYHSQSEADKNDWYPLCQAAERWLNRHRRKSTLAGIMLAAEAKKSESQRIGAVEYVAYCSIKGNGPLPDYQVRFAAVEGGVEGWRGKRKMMDEWNVEVQVQVQRYRNKVILLTKVQRVDQLCGFGWKKCSLPIEQSTTPTSARAWQLSGDSSSSLLLQDLSRRERRAIDRSLHASTSVDSVFRTLIEENR
ncbi:hypothetical protein CBS101457_006569 [Exobasidium rhododendri]|nr:hypothetical protein CBS101457_006569 [Exobasidium rhododendri]